VELDYIHIYLHSACTSGAHGITRNALARAIDTRFEVIDKWYHGHVEKIDSDILARICFVLDCTPGDIIQHVMQK